MSTGPDAALLRDRARDVVRAWLCDPDGDALGRMGQAAIRESADATAFRLGVGDDGASAREVLAAVARVADALAGEDAPARSRWWPVRKPMATPDTLTPLIDRLDRERDAAARRSIALTSARARFERAGRALDTALMLVRAVRPAIESAAREIRASDPPRAAMLIDAGETACLEREQAIVTQQAVHGQAVLTLDLLIANQQTLVATLDQARTTTLSALQVAMAARGATRDRSPLD